jgi:hypothetical protein
MLSSPRTPGPARGSPKRDDYLSILKAIFGKASKGDLASCESLLHGWVEVVGRDNGTLLRDALRGADKDGDGALT